MTTSNIPNPAIVARQCDKMIEALTDASKQGKKKAGSTTLTLTDGTICLINVLLGQYTESLRCATPIINVEQDKFWCNWCQRYFAPKDRLGHTHDSLTA